MAGAAAFLSWVVGGVDAYLREGDCDFSAELDGIAVHVDG